MADFATAADVAARWRPLSEAETSVATVLCGDASAIIRARFPGIDSQIANGSVAAAVVTQVCAGMVRRAMAGPAVGVASENETAGPYAHSQTFANPLGNVFLTAADLVLILGYQPSAKTVEYANTTVRQPFCDVEDLGYSSLTFPP